MESALRLNQLLDQAIELDRAVKGTIQLLQPDTDSLKIIAHRGFDERFLRHFQMVKRFDSSACGRAFGVGNVIMIPDIMADDGFRPHREVMLFNGIRSVKSIPILGADGLFQGMLSTHSPRIRWDWERNNTCHVAAKIALVLSEMLPAQGGE